jgi:beta-glucanase (GH16 family)
MSPRTFSLMLPLLSLRPAIHAAEPALIWSDEFHQPAGSAPDASRWTHDLGGGGWGNNELETYTDAPENCAVTADAGASDGFALAIHALAAGGGYTSARLKTQGKFSVMHGRIEARLKLTRGRGVWPALWLLGSNFPQAGWPACGEIDLMEQLGHEPGRVYGTLHGPGYSGAGGLGSSTALPGGASLSDDYHVFAIDWSPDGRIDWSLDGTIYFSCAKAQLPAGTRWVFDAPAFLILNLAVGGNWPGNPDGTTTFPQTLLIDYIRVYGVAPGAPASLVGFASAPEVDPIRWTADRVN